jgi:hypothetical protein
MVAAVVHYFFGAWRERFRFLGEEFDRAKARTELPWSDYYRSGLSVALSLSDWTTADRILGWARPDLRIDEGTDDRTAADNSYQIWLASRLRGEPAGAVAAQRESIARGSRRRPKMLLRAAESLISGDAQGLSKSLSDHLRQYRDRQMRSNRVDFGVCLDATALWHLARRRDLGEILLPQELMILIARPS